MGFIIRMLLVGVITFIIIKSASEVATRKALSVMEKYLLRYATNEHMLLTLLRDMDREDLLIFHAKAIKEIEKKTEGDD